jgi:hypothetical protein
MPAARKQLRSSMVKAKPAVAVQFKILKKGKHCAHCHR